jgi:hypothetical protein
VSAAQGQQLGCHNSRYSVPKPVCGSHVLLCLTLAATGKYREGEEALGAVQNDKYR